MVACGVNLASASWVDHFDSAGLDSAWTKSHPAATDGYYAGTGQATASTLGLSGDSYLYLSSASGAPSGNMNLVNLTRSISSAGSSDFTASMDAYLYHNIDGEEPRMDLKVIDSNGYVIAGGILGDFYTSTSTYAAATGFNFDGTNATPKDVNNDSNVIHWLGVSDAFARMTISRASNEYTLSVLAGADADHLTVKGSWDLGNSSRVVDSLQLGMCNVAAFNNPVSIDRVAFSSVPEPSSIVLSLFAGFGLAAYAWRRRKA